MKARAFRFGTGRLDRLSLVRTRRGGAMMARMPYRRISRSIRPAAGRHDPRTAIADGSARSRQGAPELEAEHALTGPSARHNNRPDL